MTTDCVVGKGEAKADNGPREEGHEHSLGIKYLELCLVKVPSYLLLMINLNTRSSHEV